MAVWMSQLAAGTIQESLRIDLGLLYTMGQRDNAISCKTLATGNYTHWYQI